MIFNGFLQYLPNFAIAVSIEPDSAKMLPILIHGRNKNLSWRIFFIYQTTTRRHNLQYN